MGFLDPILVFYFLNFFIISFLFWALTLLGSMYYDKVEYKNRYDFYECGFLSFSDFNFKINFGITISMLFVILYDIELLFLVPILINSDVLSYSNILVLCVIYLIIVITFLIDVFSDVIKWDA